MVAGRTRELPKEGLMLRGAILTLIISVSVGYPVAAGAQTFHDGSYSRIGADGLRSWITIAYPNSDGTQRIAHDDNIRLALSPICSMQLNAHVTALLPNHYNSTDFIDRTLDYCTYVEGNCTEFRACSSAIYPPSRARYYLTEPNRICYVTQTSAGTITQPLCFTRDP